MKFKMDATAGLSLTLEADILDFQSAKNRNFVKDLLMIIPGQLGFNCPCGFREEAF
jgi:hypothetical protein